MSEEPHLLVEKQGGVLILTMNRPRARNALSPEMLVRMAEAWRAFRDDRETHVAILTGAGDEDFCAGGDLKLTMPMMTGARSSGRARCQSRSWSPVKEVTPSRYRRC